MFLVLENGHAIVYLGRAEHGEWLRFTSDGLGPYLDAMRARDDDVHRPHDRRDKSQVVH